MIGQNARQRRAQTYVPLTIRYGNHTGRIAWQIGLDYAPTCWLATRWWLL